MVLDNLGAPVSELKGKNENMDICVSKVAPSLQSDTLQAKIKELNEHTQKWAEDNGITVVKPDFFLKPGTGETDETCYDTYGEHQGSILNRTSVVRLLKAMVSQFSPFGECANWEKVRKNSNQDFHDKHARNMQGGNLKINLVPAFTSSHTLATDGSVLPCGPPRQLRSSLG